MQKAFSHSTTAIDSVSDSLLGHTLRVFSKNVSHLNRGFLFIAIVPGTRSFVAQCAILCRYWLFHRVGSAFKMINRFSISTNRPFFQRGN